MRTLAAPAAGREFVESIGEVDGAPDFADAYARHYPDALRWATALMADRDAACDVVQEAFLRIFSTPHRLRRPEAFAAYLRRTVARTATSRWRSSARDSARAERVYSSETSFVHDPVEADPSLFAAVERLPDRQRAVVIMRFWLDWSESEIASALRCRPGTVKSLCSRALDALRKEFPDV